MNELEKKQLELTKLQIAELKRDTSRSEERRRKDERCEKIFQKKSITVEDAKFVFENYDGWNMKEKILDRITLPENIQIWLAQNADFNSREKLGRRLDLCKKAAQILLKTQMLESLVLYEGVNISRVRRRPGQNQLDGGNCGRFIL